MKDSKKYICECIGTAVLVLIGCGVATITEGNIIATPLAFGLSIVAMAYVIGNISGCHLNPAVSLAMLINKKITTKDFAMYVVSQVVGAFIGIGILYLIISSCGMAEEIQNFGANGFGDNSTMEINAIGAFLVEIILTFIFVYTILGVTSDENKSSIAGVVIGLTLAFVHLFGIPFTGTSVNPARSLAPAVISGVESLKQVWVFIVAPLCGSALSAVTFKYLNRD